MFLHKQKTAPHGAINHSTNLFVRQGFQFKINVIALNLKPHFDVSDVTVLSHTPVSTTLIFTIVTNYNLSLYIDYPDQSPALSEDILTEEL